ncbi:glutathione S-transferase [Tepidamorphus gemmatus]|uniref:Glutathione S-transferase n=1 Tax=Tepidamorphus gemmatus TaxID=747076 RepID=A0A4R3MMH7_9HYPH|nr:glutathione S-transferase [Tepidamorphus gemmatus]TCT13680.1 glutathione S-transferase [Tepidamorphus gemmatus]
MMILRSSPASPFGRKVKIAAKLLGLQDRIRVETTDTVAPADGFLAENPLGKIPTLVLEDGSTLYDSRVIVEYLDHLAGGGRLIPTGEPRFRALKMQALADGLMDAALLIVYESRFRPPEMHHPPWLDRQSAKIARALLAFHASPPPLTPKVDIGHIALACALGYLDLRFDGRWRSGHPRLVAWLDAFGAQVPAYGETTPVV